MAKMRFSARNRKRVMLIGGAGWPNYGDELILDAWKRYLLDNDIASHVYFFEGMASIARELHNENAPKTKLYFNGDLEKISASNDSDDFWENVLLGYRFFSDDNKAQSKNYNFSFLKKCDVIHLHGGGYLTRFWPRKAFVLGFAAAASKKYGIKLVATGIGFGPAPDVPDDISDTLSEVFEQFEFFELRDKDGFAFLKHYFEKANFIKGIDDSFLRPIETMYISDNGGSKRLYLSFLKNSVRQVPDHVWRQLKHYVEEDGIDEVCLLESSPEQDVRVLELIEDRLKLPIKMISVYSLLKGDVTISNDDKVICCRYHAHLLFARANCAGFYSTIGQNPGYYDVKHNSVVDMGSGLSLSELKSFPNEIKENSKTISQIVRKESVNHEFKVGLANKIYL